MKEKIKELGKRLLTIAVALAMVVTCIPGTAFGAETSEKVKKNVRVPDTFTLESWAEFKEVRDSIDDVDEIPDKFVGVVLQNLQEAINNLE